MTDERFNDIRPYHDDEVHAAMCRIADSPLLQNVADFLYAGVDIEQIKSLFRSIHTSYDFQMKVMHFAIHEIARKTCTKFTCEAITQLDTSKSYLFISNHRDILLDSALYQIALHDNGYKTSEITFGSNLMNPDFVVDVGRSNKMFRVERGGNPREFYHHSRHLSDYIRYTIKHKHESIWIAQRNGRTKDGNDMTDQGILKMFSMSGSHELIHNFSDLNIAPLSISYQYEPCIVGKVRELYISKTGKYEKAPGEDLQSILLGITQFKGLVNIQVTKPITHDELESLQELPKTEIYTALLQMIDTRIHTEYKLYDTNYMAYDILHNSQTYLDSKYSQADKQKFEDLVKKDISQIEGDAKELEKIYLGIYANPVINALKY